MEVLRSSKTGPPVPRDARRAASQWLVQRRIADELADRVVLVVSELATNAVRHAGTELVLSLELTDDGVQIELFDANPTPPVLVDAAEDAIGGRGIQIVAEVSRAWGSRAHVRDGVPGKVVWALLA